MKYRKKPVVIEAVEWTGENEEEIRNFVGTPAKFSYYPLDSDATSVTSERPEKSLCVISLSICTLEGEMFADVGDYIIKGVNGEFYPCKPNIFQKTYEPADDLEYMTFGDAIEVLKQGGVVRRKGWNGKNLVIIKQVPAHIGKEIIPNMQSLPQAAKEVVLSNAGFVNYTNQCLIYNTATGQADSWIASSSDIFAEDWEIVK